jgi:hypothetical protein
MPLKWPNTNYSGNIFTATGVNCSAGINTSVSINCLRVTTTSTTITVTNLFTSTSKNSFVFSFGNINNPPSV